MCHAYLKGEGFLCRTPTCSAGNGDDSRPLGALYQRGNWLLPNNPCLFKTTIQQPLTDFEDHFTENKLKVDWTWNYPYSDINIVLKRKAIPIRNSEKDNQRGTALCFASAVFSLQLRDKSDSR